MANRKVSLVRYCKTPDGWRRYSAVIGKNGRIKPGFVTVKGRQHHYPEGHYEARYYEEEFHAGRTLVTVQADGRIDDAQAIMRRHGAYDIHTKSTYKESNEYQRKQADISTVDYFPVRPTQPR